MEFFHSSQLCPPSSIFFIHVDHLYFVKLSSFSTFRTHPQSRPSPHLGTTVVISHAFIIYTAHGPLHFYCTDCSSLRRDCFLSCCLLTRHSHTSELAVDVCGFPETSWSPGGIFPVSTVWRKSHTANVEIASNTTSWRPCPGQHPVSMQRPAAGQAMMRLLTELLYPGIHTTLLG